MKIERLNNTLRQRCPRLVRKTLSISRPWDNHRLVLRYFLFNYNIDKLFKNTSLLLEHYPILDYCLHITLSNPAIVLHIC
nr:hypothetical protein [Pontibacter silvestris]